MKISIFSSAIKTLPIEEGFKLLQKKGIHYIEMASGGFSGKDLCDPKLLVENKVMYQEFTDLLKRYELEIVALSCHGNPVHPNKAIAAQDHEDYLYSCRLAEKLGIDRVVAFSGCPGDCAKSEHPNWVTVAWPTEFGEVLDYQWNDVLIPYWENAVKIAGDYGVKKVALELHGGFCCYNPSSLLKLRSAVGKTIGANVDPSHFYWQGIDSVAAIQNLGEAVYFFHAKDTRIEAINFAVNGCLDNEPYTNELKRTWLFSTVGYGHGAGDWKKIMAALSSVGYDDVISIEQEDMQVGKSEGISKAKAFLDEIIFKGGRENVWWA